jgi:D-serine dehydratase
MKFDRVIERTVQRYTKTNPNLGLINSELTEIKGAMNKNLEKLYGRGKAISEMREVASEVLEISGTLSKRATQTKRELMFRKYLFFGIICAVVLLIILWKLWF